MATEIEARDFAIPTLIVSIAVSIALVPDEDVRWGIIGLLFFAIAVCAVWFRLPRWLYLFFAIDLLSPPAAMGEGGAAFHFSVVAAALGMCIGALRWQEWGWRGGHLLRAAGFFVLAVIASLPFAVFYSGAEIAAGSAARVALLFISPFALVFALCGPGMRSDEPLRLGRFLFAFASVSAAFACLDYYFHFPAPTAFSGQYVWLAEGVFRRAQGLFYDAATLGNFCAFFLIYGLISLIERPRRWPIAAGVMVLAAALMLSYSRASVLNVAIAMAVYVALWAGKRADETRPAPRVPVMIAVMFGTGGLAALAIRFFLPFFAASYWLRIETIFTFFRERPDLILSGRLSNWQLLSTFITDHPWQTFFGIGYKTLPYTSYLGDPVIADNTYLSLLIETGIAGLGTFLVLLVGILKTTYRAARSSSPQAAFLGTWAFCFWCGQTIQMLSGDLLTYWRVIPLYFWLVGAALRATERAE